MATSTRAPTSDEAVSGTWTGSAGSRYTAVDDYPDASGSDSLTHGTTAGNLTFGFSAFSLPAGALVQQVSVQYYDQKSASQAAAAAGRLKVGGTYYDATTHNPANATWTAREDVWATNPKTSAAWTVAQVNGTDGTNDLQAFGFFSNDASPTVLFSSVRLVVTYLDPLTATLAVTEAGDTLGAAALADLLAAAAATEATDTLSAAATLETGGTAVVSWVQGAPDPVASAAITEAGDTLSSALTGDAGATARVSWVQGAEVVGGIALAVTDADDTLSASATAGAVPGTARIAWVQGAESTEPPIDVRVAGAWSPALRARWVLLFGGDPPEGLVATLAVTDADDVVASTAALLSVLYADASITEAADTVVSYASEYRPAEAVRLNSRITTSLWLSSQIELARAISSRVNASVSLESRIKLENTAA